MNPAWLLLCLVPLQDDRDIEYALKLARNGQFDLAEHALRGALADPARKTRAERVYMKIQLWRLENQPASRNKIEQVSKIIAYLSEHKDREAAYDLAHAYEIRGQAHGRLGNLAEARQSLKNSRDLYNGLFADSKEPLVKVDAAMGLAYATWLSMLFADPADPAGEWLKQCGQMVEEALWYDTYLDAGIAAMWLARAHHTAVERAFASDWKTVDLWFDCSWKTVPKGPIAAEKVIEAVGVITYQWMVSLNARKGTANAREALARAAEFRKRVPSPGKVPIVGWITLEEARALLTVGELAAALMALRSLKTDDAELTMAAQRMLADTGAATLEEVHALAEAEYAADNLAEARRRYRQGTLTDGPPALRSRCWFKLGECYYHMNRYLEAVEAFSQVETIANAPDAREAANMKYRCLLHIASLTGAEQDRARAKEFRKVLFDRGWLDEFEIRNEAVELYSRQEWAKAEACWAKLYDHSKPERRIEALATGALCFHYMKKPAEARALAERALAEIARLSIVDPGLLGDVAAATYCVAASETDARRVAELATSFVTRYPKAAADYKLRLLLTALQAQVRADALAEAQRFAEKIEEIFMSARAGRAYYLASLEGLGKAYDKKASELEHVDEKTSLQYLEKATQYLHRLVQMQGGTYELIRSLATRAFKVAVATGDTVWYDRARAFFEAMISKHLAEVEKEEIVPQVHWHIAICRLRAGHFDAALERLERLHDVFKSDPEYLEALGDAHAGKAVQLQGNARVQAYQKSAQYFQRAKDGSKEELHYRATYKWLKTMMEYDPDRVARIFVVYEKKNLLGLDEDKFGYKSRVLELKKKVDAIRPK